MCSCTKSNIPLKPKVKITQVFLFSYLEKTDGKKTLANRLWLQNGYAVPFGRQSDLQMKMRKTSISVTNIVNREGMTDK
jgi:hypothetical protein